MQVAETKNEGLKRAYKVTVPAADIEARLTDRLGEIARTARMPGFRPGKVPVNLLRKTHGNAVMGEILEQTVNESSQSAISDNELRPVAQPKIEINNFEDGKDLEYTIELEVYPKITLADFGTIKVERFKVLAKEEEVEATITKIAESHKETKIVKQSRKVEKGDVVVIDFLGRVEGKAFAGGEAENYSLEIGSGSFVPGFEEQIIGHEPGENFEVSVSFPENYSEELADKDGVFEVTIKELREAVPIEINDELAKKTGVDNLDELRGNIRESHEQELNAISRMRVKRDLLDILDKEHKFDLPEGMAEEEFKAIWEQFKHQRENHPEQLDEDDKNKSEDKLKTQYREIAERRVRLALLLAEIGRVNDITVTPEELNRALMQEAQSQKGQEKEVLDYYKKNPQALQALRSPILEEKVVDFILELADVSEREVTIDELMKEPDKVEAKSEDADNDSAKKKKVGKKRAAVKAKSKKKTP